MNRNSRTDSKKKIVPRLGKRESVTEAMEAINRQFGSESTKLSGGEGAAVKGKSPVKPNERRFDKFHKS